MEAGLMKKIILSVGAGLLDKFMILSVPFCTWHFVRYHFVLEPYYVIKPEPSVFVLNSESDAQKMSGSLLHLCASPEHPLAFNMNN